MKIASLGVEQCVRAAGRRGIVARHLIRKGIERVAVGIKYRRSQPSAEVPRITRAARSRVQVFDALLVGILSVAIVSIRAMVSSQAAMFRFWRMAA